MARKGKYVVTYYELPLVEGDLHIAMTRTYRWKKDALAIAIRKIRQFVNNTGNDYFANIYESGTLITRLSRNHDETLTFVAFYSGRDHRKTHQFAVP